MAGSVAVERSLAQPGIRQWITRHPVVAYFVFAYAGTWLLELPMVLGKDGLGLLPYSVPFAVYVPLFLLSSYAGPTLAAFLVTGVLEGRSGTRALFRRYGQWRVGLPWYLIAVFSLPLIYIVAACIRLGAVPVADFSANWSSFFTFYLPALLIFPAFITWGEEPGWRGFALTRLQQGHSPWLASVIVGVLHGLWHLPVFMLVAGPPAIGPFDPLRFFTNTAQVVVITIIWTWVFNRARGSILIAVLLHAGLNASQGWVLKLIPNYPKGTGTIAIGVFVVWALILLVTTRGQLGYQPPEPPAQLPGASGPG